MKKSFLWDTRAFTLIELMVVAAILSLLVAIALPKFGNMLTRAHESATRGGLGAFRGALRIYYCDQEQLLPVAGGLEAALTTGGKYIDEVPKAYVPPPGNHGVTRNISDYSGALTDLGDWMYFSSSGEIIVNCTHPDSTGRIWSTW